VLPSNTIRRSKGSAMATDSRGSGLPWVEAIARSFEPLSFFDFHRTRLPALVARHGRLVADDLRLAAPLAFRLPTGEAFTWKPAPQGLEILDGDHSAETVVELGEETFSEFIHQLITASGAAMTGRVRLVRGGLPGWQRFEPAIQSLCEGREIYGPQVWQTLVDRAGKPLDLRRRFSTDDDVDELRHFFRVAGYLHLRAAFTPDEIERFGREVEHVRSKTTPGDPFSWWSIDASGREVVTRINYLGRHSRDLQTLSHDPRLARFARLAGSDLRVCDDRLDGPMVFVKNSHVVKGNGDLGWHVDDGIGGHPVMCPLIQAGIQLDRANAENGQLGVLAGSHRYSKHWIQWGQEGGLPAVFLETEPGDLTLHYGDAMHTTPPPTGANAGRRALYYKFAEPKTFEWVPADCHYNDALFRPDPTGRTASRAASA
jgi:Phytanoyl-CoA dioxygenase (PhyH)